MVRWMSAERNVQTAVIAAMTSWQIGTTIENARPVAADATRLPAIGAVNADSVVPNRDAKRPTTKVAATENIAGLTGKISVAAKTVGVSEAVFIEAVARNSPAITPTGAGIEDATDATTCGPVMVGAVEAATAASVGRTIEATPKDLAAIALHIVANISDAIGDAASGSRRDTTLAVGGDTTTGSRGFIMRGGGSVCANRLVVDTDGPPSSTASASAGASASTPHSGRRWRIEVDSERLAARDATSRVRTCLSCISTSGKVNLRSMPSSQRPMLTRTAS